MDKLDPSDRPCRIAKCLEAKHRSGARLDRSVVLFNDVVQIPAASDLCQRMHKIMISRSKCRYLNRVLRLLEEVMIGSKGIPDQSTPTTHRDVVAPEPVTAKTPSFHTG
jgi:hypothetical protein